MPDLASRYEGCVLGLAIGDALGFPTEFLRLEEIRARFGPSGVRGFEASHHPPGTFTDDTQMSVALAKALIVAGDEDIEGMMEQVGKEFVAWSKSPDNTRAPGRTCMNACAKLAAGVPWLEAGANDSKGCGTAMRAAPVALRYPGDRARIIEVARAQSLATHGHPFATGGSVAVAVGVDLALAGVHPSDWCKPLVEATDEFGEAFTRHIAGAVERDGRDTDADLRQIGEGWVAEEAVAAALYCVLQSPEDYEATVLLGANTEGDSDSIACIAGAMSGAFNGVDAIPAHWRRDVEDAEGLVELAHGLMQAAGVS